MSQDFSVHLAIDLGASNGRVIAGLFEEGTMTLEEVHRFDNEPIEKNGGLYSDFDGLWQGILEGLGMAVHRYGADRIQSIGVDTWGVDFGYLDDEGNLLSPPRQYRDLRNADALRRLTELVPASEIFEESGIQFMEINSSVQLVAELEAEDSLIPRADQFLMIPDLVNYRLTGIARCERTNASTTQLLRPVERDWSWKLFDALGIPRGIAPELIDAGAVIGVVEETVCQSTGLSSKTRVVTVGSHDTASAVAAIPAAEHSRYAYLSSGTWSLLGVEVDRPIINDLALDYNLTNEAGVFGNIRLLKNINGLWPVQECRRIWNEEGQDWGYADLAKMAGEVEGFQSLIDPDEERFSRRDDMPGMIREYCRETGQIVPETPGEVLRVIGDSLALKVRYVLSHLEDLVGYKVDVLHIIGGGGQDDSLNQAIANSIQRPVVVGPFEATAAGNIMMQVLACGKVDSLAAGRKVIRESFGTKTYQPEDSGAWEEAYQSFTKLLKD